MSTIYSRWNREAKYRRKKAWEEYQENIRKKEGTFGLKEKATNFAIKAAGKIGAKFGIPPKVTETLLQGVKSATSKDVSPDDYYFLSEEQKGKVDKYKKEEIDKNFKKIISTYRKGSAKEWAEKSGGKFLNDDEMMKAYNEYQKKRYGENFLGSLKEDVGLGDDDPFTYTSGDHRRLKIKGTLDNIFKGISSTGKKAGNVAKKIKSAFDVDIQKDPFHYTTEDHEKTYLNRLIEKYPGKDKNVLNRLFEAIDEESGFNQADPFHYTTEDHESGQNFLQRFLNK
jgi:hypothetical protein